MFDRKVLATCRESTEDTVLLISMFSQMSKEKKRERERGENKIKKASTISYDVSVYFIGQYVATK